MMHSYSLYQKYSECMVLYCVCENGQAIKSRFMQVTGNQRLHIQLIMVSKYWSGDQRRQKIQRHSKMHQTWHYEKIHESRFDCLHGKNHYTNTCIVDQELYSGKKIWFLQWHERLDGLELLKCQHSVNEKITFPLY